MSKTSSLTEKRLFRAARVLAVAIRLELGNKKNNLNDVTIDINLCPEGVEVEFIYDSGSSIIYLVNFEEPMEYPSWVEYIAKSIISSSEIGFEGYLRVIDYDHLYRRSDAQEYELLETREFTEKTPSTSNTPNNLCDMAASIRGARLQEGYEKSSLPDDWDGQDHSILWILGYSVGKSSPFKNKEERKAFLLDFIKTDLPLVFPEPYLNEWGEAESSQRLYRMVNHLSALISMRSYNEGRYKIAISEWKDDIAFIEAHQASLLVS